MKLNRFWTIQSKIHCKVCVVGVRNYYKMPSAKVVLVGDAGVGKTCICERLTKDSFIDSNAPTIGAANFSVSIETDRGKIEFNIWDTAGQEKYRSLAPMYFAGSQAAILVFDLTSEQSLTALDSFFDILQQRAPPDCVYVLVGNKSDKTQERTVSREMAENYQSRIGAAFYIETSAMTGEGVQELFNQLATTSQLALVEDDPDYVLSTPTTTSTTSKGCC